MKTIEEILNNYKEYVTVLDDRFGTRLCDFLTEEQGKKIGFTVVDGCEWGEVKEFTEENVLKQLKEDIEFGYEKAMDERGISANLMYEVVRAWLKVLEDENEYPDYDDYGKEFFEEVAKNYGVTLGE